jgi:competence protein ComEA
MKKLIWIVACCVLGALSVPAARLASAAPTKASAAAASSATPAPTAESGGVVNLNEASPEQLALLPGVGPSRANAIVSHRKTHPFKRLEELMRVKGIGKKTFARLRPLLSLSGPTTLKDRPHRG